MTGGFFDFKRVRRRLRSPVTTGAGAVDSVDRIILRTQSDQGTGYGEIAPWPGFPTESVEQALEFLRSAQGNLPHLIAAVHASPAALPCLSAALSSCQHWDQIAGFGGSLPCAGLMTLSVMETDAKVAAGFKTLKVKISPETSEESIHGVLSRFPGRLRLDANGSLDLQSARRWTEFARTQTQVEFLEQPLPVGHPGYASLGPDKIALDESFLTPGGIDWSGTVVVKPLLAGDWDDLLAWRATHAGTVVYSSCFETAIGRQGALWLAALDAAAGTVGFDTLGRFESDGRDRHAHGPHASGLPGYDWAGFWHDLT
jgi:O-succinylbenzoate synthase